MGILSVKHRKKIEKHLEKAFEIVSLYGTTNDPKVRELKKHIVNSFVALSDTQPINFEGGKK